MAADDHVLTFERKAFERTKCPCSKNSLERIPCAEYDERDRNPSSACRHVLLPSRYKYKRKISTAQSAQKSASTNVDVFIQRHIYSGGVRGARILSDCTNVQTPARILVIQKEKY